MKEIFHVTEYSFLLYKSSEDAGIKVVCILFCAPKHEQVLAFKLESRSKTTLPFMTLI